ncbi:branched-chain amino acid ABC transporter permease [Phreatobacter aquaticus]|uniref:Branched-chain amino acid ABC transporter permease n=1 Tax=Phreatobacter aquaticus TaxID=2570229 RepID=A0A4D7QJE3_9HYPH|nr:branched-chain amino acid ABC transporter permease [Phreatobacter aquaticus]QCK85504.1 branched-chain amino acid ABC transporter permease [Phreatobacter aquaticus]
MQFIQLVVSGLAQGCIYGLIALGFVLIYKATETVNFAQGELMMIGAFSGLFATTVLGLPYWLSLAAAMIATALVGLMIERLVLRPILGHPAFSIVMVTIGIGYMARGLVTMIPVVGTDTHSLPTPFRGEVFRLGGLVISAEHVVVIAVTLILCGALAAMFRYTKIGIAMQAMSQNQLAAYYMGIPVKRFSGLIWGISAAVAAIAGILLAPLTFIHANMGFIGIKAFPAAVIGGFTSLPGAIVGGLIIGVVEALAGFYLIEGFKDVAAFVVVLIMLVVKPTGLFGERLAKKV